MNYFAILKSQKHPFRFLLSRVLGILGIGKFLTIERPGYKLKFYPTGITQHLWINYKNTSTPDEIFFRKYLHPGDTVIDVGANIGNISLSVLSPLGAGSDTVSIYAVEPNKQIFKILEENVLLNNAQNRIRTLNYALGEEERFISLTPVKNDALKRVVLDADKDSQDLVKMQRLDALLSHLKKINLLKIDVEGFELFVLKGSRQLLPHIDLIYFEYKEAHVKQFNYSFDALHRYLTEMGFSIYNPDFKKGELLKIEHLAVQPKTKLNLVAINNNSRETRERLNGQFKLV